MSVVIETTIGDITVDLFVDERPISCLNFIKLCKLKYYNYNLFHTIEQGFIAQSGDPTGAGNGGSSIWGVLEGMEKRFYEAETLPKIHHTNSGLLSLVSAGKNLVGSQFFFTLGANLSSLDGIHCVIGEVCEGQETLRKLNEAIVDENFRPYQDIRITHTVILDDPFPDPRGFQVPSRSPSPSAERLQNGRIAADEDIDNTEGKSMEEIQEMLAEREAKARATILEIVGDLPSADMAPPENVLFVCKLNPVTTDDDLEIIFNRFGKVKGCEVIRDKKTGDSLQYAFVEFEDRKACEAAYFKMDNVLIDDRRIHVDFSQSVARVKWRGKGRGIEGNLKGLDFDNLRSGGGDGGDWQRNGNKHNVRMSSKERRQAREERHREQEKREKEHGRRYDSRDDRNRRDDRISHRRSPERSERVRDRRYSRERMERARSRSTERRRRTSPPERERDGRADRIVRRRDDTERRRDDTIERRRNYTTQNRSSDTAEKRREERIAKGRDDSIMRNREKDSQKRRATVSVKKDKTRSRKAKSKDYKKKRSKRSQCTTSSDSSTSSDSESDITDNSDSTSSETSDSTSEAERHKRKKKHTKKKSKSKKSKKHRK